MTKALLQNVIIPDSTAGIVEKLKEEIMMKWRHYRKAESEEDRKTFLQKNQRQLQKRRTQQWKRS
jgi:type III secretory pathway component EscR